MEPKLGFAPNNCCPGWFQVVPLTGVTYPQPDGSLWWEIVPGTVCSNCGTLLGYLVQDDPDGLVLDTSVFEYIERQQ